MCGDHDIYACTHGLLFFGTPHHGSNAADWLSYVEKIAALTLAPLHVKSDLVNELRRESKSLQGITNSFVPLMKHFNIFFFWEQEKTKLPGKFTRKYIVTSESAAPIHDNTERAGIAANHSNMVKFDDTSSPGFRTVVEAVIRYCKEASANIQLRGDHAAKTLFEERHAEFLQALRHTGLPVSTTRPAFSPVLAVSRASTLVSSRDPEGTSRWDYKGQEDAGEDMFSKSYSTLA